MNLAYAFAAFLLALVLVLVGVTRVGAWLIERRHPPSGSFATVNDTRLHYVHVPAGDDADLPPLVFIHGASGNLLDPMLPLRPLLEGRAELLFVDRPGHGWSGRGPAANGRPDGQAATVAALMDELGIEDAIIVGHSFGGAIAATFALEQPARTRGVVLLAAVSHPWPGGETSWYYELTATPLIGPLFSETLAYPGGALRMAAASACVFAPNRLPEAYDRNAAIALVLRPAAFRANSRDVAGLYDYVKTVAPRYGEISAPTVVISGTRDTVVYEEIHSTGLGRDIPGAELVWVKNLGHKPDWIVPDLAVAAIEKAAGKNRDLQALARAVEARIAGDAFGPIANCPDEKPDPSAMAAGG
ncbi:alpha/beta hydrolase [Nitratireductor mangrovi]|uniref:Alpha/beta hydrolase n=1 Tax=Nitratireductor mangrovi TaxID=2599600 RepID=A0A5B8KWR1_9HYPH|nr:alpha/beta hydrolase [Nitratireductor mangrovi]QDZ00035.1 alpha/beta hydrolase [Nitratireductor mangrovi]